jgi:hypothetical protein
MSAITVEVFIAGFFSLGTPFIYLGFHKWRANPFTRMFATLTTGFALILAYVWYNIAAELFGWPIATGTIVAVIVYGLIALIEVVMFSVVYYLTFIKRRL